MPVGRLRKFLALPRDQRSMLVAALVGLPLVTGALRLVGYKRLRDRLTVPQAALSQASVFNRVEAERVARMVRLASGHGLVRGTCLSRALLLRRMLQRRGIPAEIRFGVRADGNAMEAHAWVEQDGRPLDDEFEDDAFADLEPAHRADTSTRPRA